MNLLPNGPYRPRADSYSIKEKGSDKGLLPGLTFDSPSGAIHGTPAKDQKEGEYKYVVTAKNALGERNTEITLTVMALPGKLDYQSDKSTFGNNTFSPCKVGEMKSGLTTKDKLKSPSFSIAPKLPEGLVFRQTDGRIKGTYVAKKADPEKVLYQVTARNQAGKTTFPLTINYMVGQTCPVPAGFPWWIVVVILLLAALVYWYMNRPEPEPVAYTPLVAAEKPKPEPTPPPPPPPPPAKPVGLPLTWVTPTSEVTVFAIRKPLGLVFERHNPIKITSEKDSHGKDLGIKVGWILKAVNYVDISGMDFKDADKILHTEVGKLPGAIPLKFKTPAGAEETVWAMKKPLGLTFEKEVAPIKITQERDGHGKDIGVKVGWVLTAVNYIDVSKLTSFKEVETVLKAEIGKLPHQ